MSSDSLAPSISKIWSLLPNEQTLSNPRRSRARSVDQPTDFNPSPRSSISSSFSSTPLSSASPAPNTIGLFLDPSQSPKPAPSPKSTPSLGLYPDNAGGVFSGLAFLAGRERDFGVSFSSATISSPTSAPTVQSAPTLHPPSPPQAPPTPTSALSPTLPADENTQLALAEIFAGTPRPHYRSAASAQPITTSPADAPQTSSPRSYFSPPLPSALHLSRARSQSSASVLDHSSMSSSNSFGRSSQQQSQQSPADQHGYRPSTTAMSSHYSSSLPASIPQAIRIGSAGTRDESSPSRPRLGQLSTGSSYSNSSASFGGNGGVAGSSFDQTGWRSSAGTKQPSFSWEDSDREARSRSRGEEQYRPWGERDVSTSSTGTGIALSNMSPFSRDGGRTLLEMGNDGASGYMARRDYSLGAVGSGRKRGESVWGSSRTLREAEDEDADDAFAPPTKSGATSRRHSIAGFNPPSRSQIGFSMPEENKSNVNTNGNYGRSLATRGGFGGAGNSAINDDDLAADLNSLQLNLEAHVAATESTSTRTLSHIGSMPTNFPPSTQSSRGFDDSQSRSPPAIGSRHLHSPTAEQFSATTGASRFFQAPSPGLGNGSRFEFGGVGSSGPQGTADFGSSIGLGGHQQQQQQREQSGNTRYRSFALPPPSPPQPFYSTPLSPHGLSAQAPSFQGFSGPGGGQHQHQQQSFYQAPPSNDLANLGRGIPLHAVPANAPLYIVEFKAGRKDLFFVEDPNLQLRQGDLVIVEADRGKDIGKLASLCSADQVQAFQQQRIEEQAFEQLSGAAPLNAARLKTLTPKKIFNKAQPVDTHLLLSKAQDEVKALALVKSKVAQKNLPMEVCDAEWQWDRRKLTFYYVADSRVDFRELVRELFRLYKTRIWMCCLDQQQASLWEFK